MFYFAGSFFAIVNFVEGCVKKKGGEELFKQKERFYSFLREILVIYCV